MKKFIAELWRPPPWLWIGLTAVIVFVGTFLLQHTAVVDPLKDEVAELRNDSIKQGGRIQDLKGENTRLQKRIASTKDPWLPDTLRFADQSIDLTDPDNWYVKQRLKNSVRSLLSPAFNETIVLIAKRAEYWFPIIEQKLAEADFFDDAKYLFVQESLLDPEATSHADAKGIAQFMPLTARSYGLTVNWQFDERLLPEKAIEASIRYQKKLYKQFDQDIFLAFAGYNTGEPNLIRSLRKHKGQRSFFSLGRLHPETGNYSYAIPAVKLVMENKEKYGIEIPDNLFYEYPPVTLVDTTLTSTTDISAIASHYCMGHPEFEYLNPHLRRDRLEGKYTFRIPEFKYKKQTC